MGRVVRAMTGSTRAWATSRPSSSSKATTPLSTESCNPHRERRETWGGSYPTVNVECRCAVTRPRTGIRRPLVIAAFTSAHSTTGHLPHLPPTVADTRTAVVTTPDVGRTDPRPPPQQQKSARFRRRKLAHVRYPDVMTSRQCRVVDSANSTPPRVARTVVLTGTRRYRAFEEHLHGLEPRTECPSYLTPQSTLSRGSVNLTVYLCLCSGLVAVG